MKRLSCIAAIATAAAFLLAAQVPAADVVSSAGNIAPTSAPSPASKPASATTAPNQLRCLDAPAKPRFAITDRVWPGKPGEAHICLWADDKLAAASITIDDNWAPDHAWWIEQGKKTGFRFTWFVITERVSTGGLWGSWDAFKKLHELGHDVQSHTVSHLHGQYDIETEYRDSQAAIEKNMPGNKVMVLAYPGGQHDVKNDTVVAARYYVGGRGVVGTPNAANMTNYMLTRSTSLSPETIDKVLNRNDRNYWRGWLCTHFHGISGDKTQEEKDAKAKRVGETIAYLKSKEADIWVAKFREVVLYGQERDTATLTTVAHAERSVTLSLTDMMDDSLFDYPLTVKVRLPEAWSGVSAVQNGKAVAVRMVEREGGKFALVSAVPDRGQTVLTPAEAPAPSSSPARTP